MPIYTFECNKGHRNDYLVKIGDKPFECSDCKSQTLERRMESERVSVHTSPRETGAVYLPTQTKIVGIATYAMTDTQTGESQVLETTPVFLTTFRKVNRG